LTQEELDVLRASKGEIIAILRRSENLQTPTQTHKPRRPTDRIPLAFSQLFHWHVSHLSTLRSARSVASALTLRGPVNLKLLEHSLNEVVRHHEALRTQITVVDDVPMQVIRPANDCPLKIEYLYAYDRADKPTLVAKVIERVLAPIDITADPLFEVSLLKICDEEHILIVAMEHLISDAFSRGILIRDLLNAYHTAIRGLPVSLPPVTIQFADYALWQRSTDDSWRAEHGAHWNQQQKRQRVSFPADRNTKDLGWGIVPIRIVTTLRKALREWSRLRRTTPAMAVFTAYAALVMRWCAAPEIVIQYQINGRDHPSLENTIGYLASVLYIQVEMVKGDNFLGLLNRITAEYCRAHAHADSYRLAARGVRPEIARGTCFNWVPPEPIDGVRNGETINAALSITPFEFEVPMPDNLELDDEPFILLFDREHDVIGTVRFPRSRFSQDAMDKFGREFLRFVEILLRDPDKLVDEIEIAP